VSAVVGEAVAVVGLAFVVATNLMPRRRRLMARLHVTLHVTLHVSVVVMILRENRSRRREKCQSYCTGQKLFHTVRFPASVDFVTSNAIKAPAGN
jgi:hypothetical protein